MDTTSVCRGFGTSSACGECQLELHRFNVGMLTRQDLCKVVRKFVIVAKAGTLLLLSQCVIDCNCEIISTVHDGAPATINNTITYVRGIFSVWLDVQKQMYIGKDTKSKRNDMDACSGFLEKIESYTDFQDLLNGISQLSAKPYGRTYIEDSRRVNEANQNIRRYGR